jgi:chromosome segregation ATPase
MTVTAGVAERAITSMAGLNPQIVILEKRITADSNSAIAQTKKNDERHQEMTEHLTTLNSSITESCSKLEKTNTVVSKLNDDMNELETRSNSRIAGVETRLSDGRESDKKELTKKLNAVQTRLTSESERLQKDINNREQETASKTRNQIDDVKRTLSEEINRKCLKVQESATEECKALKAKMKSQIVALDASVEKVKLSQLALTAPGTVLNNTA